MRLILIVVLLLVAALLAYIRLAPADIAKIHLPTYPASPGDRDEIGSFRATRAVTAPAEDVLQAIDTIALQTPRTKLIAGSVGEGMMTYETRSRLMGFPDYTTVWVDSTIDGTGPHVNIFGRLRFGQADLGVNKARITSGWISLAP